MTYKPVYKELPKRPFKTLDDYIVSRVYLSKIIKLREKHKNPSVYPCTYCEGSGKYHDPKDRDEYEGYKLAPLYTCRTCNGTGLGQKNDWKPMYDNVISIWKENLNSAKETVRLQKSAVSKLTPDEILSIVHNTFNYKKVS